jgi:protoporphyrinogen oxidase
MINKKYLILGAGVSGLSFANYINSNNLIIIEKNKEIGGYCRSIKEKGFTWDYSGHYLHFKNQEIKKEIKLLLKNDLIKLKKNSKIIYNNRIIDSPFQHNIHQLSFKEYFECLLSFLFKNKSNNISFKNYISNTNGMAISRKFLFPYNEKLYSCNLNLLDSNAMGRFFPKTSFINFFKKEISYNDEMYYPKGGISQLISALASKLRANIINENPVKEIDINNKIVHTKNNKIKYEILINTIPLKKFYSLINNHINLDIGKLSSNKVLIFNFGFDKPSTHNANWYYIPDKEIIFYRVGFYNNIIKSEKMNIYVEIGLNEEQEIDTTFIRKKVIGDLKKLKIITNQKIIAENHIIMNPAYIHLKSEQINKIKNSLEELNKKDIYSIGRYATWSYKSIEDCILDSKNLSNKFNKKETHKKETQ